VEPEQRTQPRRTVCYIDGLNLARGIRDANWQDLYWFDVSKLADALVRPPFAVSRVKYFTAAFSGRRPDDSPKMEKKREESRRKQRLFMEATGTLENVEIYEGRYVLRPDCCHECGVMFHRSEEKGTDVCIATEILVDAFRDEFDSALLVSGDGDLAPAFQAVKRHFPEKSVCVAFPPKRGCMALKDIVDLALNIRRSTFNQCQLPDEVRKADGTVLKRPDEWRRPKRHADIPRRKNPVDIQFQSLDHLQDVCRRACEGGDIVDVDKILADTPVIKLMMSEAEKAALPEGFLSSLNQVVEIAQEYSARLAAEGVRTEILLKAVSYLAEVIQEMNGGGESGE